MKKIVMTIIVSLIIFGNLSPIGALAMPETSSNEVAQSSEKEVSEQTPSMSTSLPSVEESESKEEQPLPDKEQASSAVQKPESTQAEVANWDQFVRAYNNETITRIKLTTDIVGSSMTGLRPRTTQLTLEGQSHRITLHGFSLPYGFVKAGTVAQIIVRDAILDNGLVEPGFFKVTNGGLRAGWRFIFSNIDGEQTLAFTDAPASHVTLTGGIKGPFQEDEKIEDIKSSETATSSSNVTSQTAEADKSSDNVEKSKVAATESKAVKAAPTVSDFKEFVDALKDESIHEITLAADIDGTGSKEKWPSEITRSITINGNFHKLNLGTRAITLGSPKAAPATFSIKAATLSNNKSGVGFLDVSGKGKWNLSFTDITTPRDAVRRLVDGRRCRATFSGKNQIKTKDENGLVGSVSIEPNSIYIGEVYGGKHAAFWYYDAATENDTGANREFRIGESAYADFSNTTDASGDTTYPIAFSHLRDVILDSNATLHAQWGCDAFRMNESTDNGDITIGAGATMDIDSTKDDAGYPALNYDGGRHTVTLKEGASLIAKSSGIYGAIALDGGSAPTFIATKPALIDLISTRKGTPAVTATVSGASFKISDNNNMSYWIDDYENENKPTGTTDKLSSLEMVTKNKWRTVPSELGEEMNKQTSSKSAVQRLTTLYKTPGQLQLLEAPSSMEFGKNIEVDKEKVVPLQGHTGNLTVSDTRAQESPWQLTAKLEQEFTAMQSNSIIKNILFYKNSNEEIPITSAESVITKRESPGIINVISNEWSKTNGPLLKLSPTMGMENDTYTAKILWTLKDAE